MSAFGNPFTFAASSRRPVCASRSRLGHSQWRASDSERLVLVRASQSEPSRSGDDRVVEQTRTYDESQGKVYSKSVPTEDDEGSIALLVPGGRVADRPSQRGGAAEAARREQNKPLKINTDLQLVRTCRICNMRLTPTKRLRRRGTILSSSRFVY